MKFRFTIRELVFVTAIVALVIGWWIDHRNLETKWTQLKTDVELHNAQSNSFHEHAKNDPAIQQALTN